MAEQENRNSLVVLDAKEDCREDAKAFKGVNRAREAIIPGKSGFGVGFQSPSRLRTEVGDERCPTGPTCHRKKGGTRLSVGQEEGNGKTPAAAGPRSAFGLGRRKWAGGKREGKDWAFGPECRWGKFSLFFCFFFLFPKAI